MEKPSRLTGPVDLKLWRKRRIGAVGAETGPDWYDAETRAFLEQPCYSPPFAKVLQVILITAMVVAGVKVAWILVFHA